MQSNIPTHIITAANSGTGRKPGGEANLNQPYELFILIALVSAFMIWLTWPAIWTASENTRLVSVFGQGEEEHLKLLRGAIDQKTVKLNFRYYGHLHFNIVLIPLLLLSNIMQITDQHIIVMLRLVPMMFAIGTIILTFILVRRYLDHLTAWLSALLLAFVPLVFVENSSRSRPDSLQVFFLVLCLYFCLRLIEENYSKWLLWASASAGLAFASKYSGMFLLPVIWITRLFSISNGGDQERIRVSPVQFTKLVRYGMLALGIMGITGGVIVSEDFVKNFIINPGSTIDITRELELLFPVRILSIIVGCVLILLSLMRFVWNKIESMPDFVNNLSEHLFTLAVFGAAFVIVSPFSLVRLSFVKGLLYESRHTTTGHIFVEDKNPLLWLDIMASSRVIGWLILSLAAVSFILSLYKLVRRGWRQLLNPEYILWFWVIIYLGFLLFRVRYRAEQYLIPVIPMIMILASLPVSGIIHYFTSNLSKKPAVVFTIATILVLGGLETSQPFRNLYDFRQATLHREQTSVSVNTGRWLAEKYPPSVRILYDKYSYVPPIFKDAHETGGGTIPVLEYLKPDIVIVNRMISSIYWDTDLAEKYRGEKEEYLLRHAYYLAMKNGAVNDYVLVRDFGDIQVYEQVHD